MKFFNLLLLASTALAQTASSQPEVNASTVVFVCEHGAAKSSLPLRILTGLQAS